MEPAEWPFFSRRLVELGMAVLILGCRNSQTPDGASNPDLNTVVTGNTMFALDLYGSLRTNEGNLFFSPHSIRTALAMTYGGARGETEKQMAQALHFGLPQEQLHPAFAALDAGLNKVQKKGKVTLSIANSLWPQKDYPLLPDYVKLCKKHYGVGITPVDYVGDAEDGRRLINAWVLKKTRKKITDLIPQGLLIRSTRLVLANAIYFKGNWASQFDTKLTKEEPFRLTADNTVPVPLMHRNGEFGYAEPADFQVLELPYMGDDLSMLVLLPRRVDGLAELEDKLTVEKLTVWTKYLRKQEMEVFLPKFKATSQFSLNDALAALGMTDAFNATNADFSGINGQRWSRGSSLSCSEDRNLSRGPQASWNPLSRCAREGCRFPLTASDPLHESTECRRAATCRPRDHAAQ